MKTMNVILATVTLGASALLSTVNSYAGDEMNITPITAEKKAKVELKSLKSIDVSIFVTNMKGSVLHEETIKSKSSYGRVYDFTHVPDGKYTIVSNDEFSFQSGLTGQRFVIDSMGRATVFITKINQRVVLLTCFGDFSSVDEIAATLKGLE